MKLSIIVPVYNAQEYILDCLNSLYIENEVELVIVNDGSKDKSLELINEFSKNKKNIKVIDKENSGVSDTRNIGIENATSDFIMFVDADDKLVNNWYIEISKHLENTNNDIIYFENINNITNFNNKEYQKIDLIKKITGYNEKNICIAGPVSKLYRRTFLVNNLIKFRNKIINGEDMLFNLEALSLTNNFLEVPYTFYLYRQHLTQSTKNFNKKIIDSDIMFHKELKNILYNFKFENSNINKKLEKLIQEIVNFSKFNAILIILERVSYSKITKDVRKELKKLYENIYNLEHKEIKKIKYISKFMKLRYKLYKLKLINILIFLIKSKNFTKNLLKNTDKNKNSEYILYN